MTHSLLYFAAPGRAFVGKRTVAPPLPLPFTNARTLTRAARSQPASAWALRAFRTSTAP